MTQQYSSLPVVLLLALTFGCARPSKMPADPTRRAEPTATALTAPRSEVNSDAELSSQARATSTPSPNDLDNDVRVEQEASVPSHCPNPVTEERARSLAESSMRELGGYVVNPRVDHPRRIDTRERCGVVLKVWGVESWRSRVWNQIYPPDTGGEFGQLTVHDDGRLTYAEVGADNVADIPMSDVPKRLAAAAKAMEKVRILPELRDQCRRKELTCDFTVAGMHPAECAPSEASRTDCAWNVDVYFIHSRMQLYATFHVRDDGTMFVTPSLYGAPVTMAEWKCFLRTLSYDEAACVKQSD